MLFLQSFIVNLVLTKPSGPKRHAVLLIAKIFAGFCVYHTDLGGGGAVAIAAFPPRLAAPRPPILIPLRTTHLSRQWADLPTDLCELSSPQAVS
jgi:hypothetical protein